MGLVGRLVRRSWSFVVAVVWGAAPSTRRAGASESPEVAAELARARMRASTTSSQIGGIGPGS